MRRLPAALALVLASLLAIAGCGSSSSGAKAGSTPPASSHASSPAASSPAANATAPADPAAATAEIKSLYATFFKSPIPKAKKLLQDGEQLGAAFKAADKLKGTNTEVVKVDSVKFTSPTTANVPFDLYIKQPGEKLSKTPTLANYAGAAVLVNGKWLVAKMTFCNLVQAGGTVPAGCS